MSAWQPIETAPRDGTHFFGIVDGERRIVSWGKTSHVPIYGFCLSDQGPEDFDLCDPALWHAFPALPSSEEQSRSRRCEATCAGNPATDTISPLPQPSDATELVSQLIAVAAEPWAASVLPDLLSKAADFITQAQARATAAEGERDLCGQQLRHVLASNEKNWNDLQAAQQTITQLTREREMARQVLPGLLTLARAYAKSIAVNPDGVADIRDATSFLSSLSHQDEQG